MRLTSIAMTCAFVGLPFAGSMVLPKSEYTPLARAALMALSIAWRIRHSTNEDKQNINHQLRELKDAGTENVVSEYKHGNAKYKKNLQLLPETILPGDTFIALEVSRLSGSSSRTKAVWQMQKPKA